MKSKITVECENNDENCDLATLKYIVESNVRLLVDILGYSIACGYDVEIESVYDLTTKDMEIFSVQVPIFTSEEDVARLAICKPPIAFETAKFRIYDLVGSDIPLRIAFADFREAIRNADTTAFHCMRAIESLKHSSLINQNIETPKITQLRQLLNISKKAHDKVSVPGNEQRHGKSFPQSWQQRKEQMAITWEIIRRYMLAKTSSEELEKLTEL